MATGRIKSEFQTSLIPISGIYIRDLMVIKRDRNGKTDKYVDDYSEEVLSVIF